MSFDVSNFKSPPVNAQYERGGSTLNMKIDPDILTPDFLDGMVAFAAGFTEDQPKKRPAKGKAKKTTIQELIPRVSAQQIEFGFFVGVLSRVVIAWDLTDKGKAIAPSEAFFRSLPIESLADLFTFCMEQAVPKKQQTSMTSRRQTTPATIPDGSNQAADLAADQTM